MPRERAPKSIRDALSAAPAGRLATQSYYVASVPPGVFWSRGGPRRRWRRAQGRDEQIFASPSNSAHTRFWRSLKLPLSLPSMHHTYMHTYVYVYAYSLPRQCRLSPQHAVGGHAIVQSATADRSTAHSAGWPNAASTPACTHTLCTRAPLCKN